VQQGSDKIGSFGKGCHVAKRQPTAARNDDPTARYRSIVSTANIDRGANETNDRDSHLSEMAHRVTGRWPKHWPPETADRVVVVARLKRGAHDKAAELIATGPPFDPDALGFDRHGVYLSAEEVVFAFEGPSAARRLADMINDMVNSAPFGAWAPIIDGTPRIAHESYFWKA
jgi:hypothetical protein